MTKIRADQIDLVSDDFEATGTDSRQLGLKTGAVTEDKLGFAWEVVESLASAFSFDGTRSNLTLGTAASSNAAVLDMSELLRNGIGGQTRVTTTSAAGEWSLSGTSLSVHGDITSSGDTYTLRYIIGSAGESLYSGPTVEIWSPDIVPSGLDATTSDEFTETTLDSKWTEFDPSGNNILSVSVDEYGLVLETDDDPSNGNSVAGIFQEVPAASDFEIVTQVSITGPKANFSGAGIMLGEDLAGSPTTSNLETVWFRIGGAGYDLTEAHQWTAYNSGAANASTAIIRSSNLYFLLRYDFSAEVYTIWYSTDGVGWGVLVQDRASQNAIQHFGLFVCGVNQECTARFRFFRVSTPTYSTAEPGPTGGRFSLGAGALVDEWSTEVVPAGLDALSDEFDDESVDGSWSEWDVDTELAVSEDAYGLVLTNTSTSGNYVTSGLYHDIPGTDFEVVTKVSVTPHGENSYSYTGFFLAGDVGASPSSAAVELMGLQCEVSGPDVIYHLNQADYDAGPTFLLQKAWPIPHIYFLMRYDDSANLVSYWASSDGVGWFPLLLDRTPTFTPATFGLGVTSRSAPTTSRFRFFRVDTSITYSTDPPEPIGGNI